MKLGRNEICYCGSEKKYKKCCMDKDEELANGFLNLYKGMIGFHEHIKKYDRIRRIQGSVLDSMLLYIEKNEVDIDNYVKEASTFLGKKINFDKIKKIKYDIDYLWHTLFMFGSDSLASLFLEKSMFKEAAKIKILKAMKSAYTSIFEIIKVDSSNGYVFLRDVYNGKEFKVIDKGMALNEKHIDKIYIYSRIIEVDGIMFNNVAIPLDKSNKKIINFINKGNNISDIVFSICIFEIADSLHNLVIV